MQIWIKRSIIFLLGLYITNHAVAQEGSGATTYTPYSLHGLGDFASVGTATNLGMGGVTMGLRHSRTIDLINPAGASARDSLVFVVDIGGEMRNMYAHSSSTSSSSNSALFHHFAFSFPFKGSKWGVSAGFMPFTRVGYDMEVQETDENIILSTGDVRYQYKGEDGLSLGFFNIAYNLSPKLSLGIGGKYYFGNINRYYNTIFASNATFFNSYSTNSLRVNDFAFTMGAHYTQALSATRSMTVGVAFSPAMNLKAEETRITEVLSSAYIDTASNKGIGNTVIKMPLNLSLGVGFTERDKWFIGADFVWNDWSKTEIAGKKEMGNAYDIKLGGYYIPNRYDVRYYSKRITYRAGLRYSQTPMRYNNESVKDKAVSVGLGFPIRSMGDLNFSVEAGQRGTLKNEGIVENYVNFTLSLTLFEYWFVKYKYE